MEEFDFTLNIDNYLLGRLEIEQHQWFEKELQTNNKLASQVNEKKAIIEALVVHDEIEQLQQELETIHTEHVGADITPRRKIFRRKRISKKQKLFSTVGIAAAVSIIMSITLSYILLEKRHAKKLAENHELKNLAIQISELEEELHEIRESLRPNVANKIAYGLPSLGLYIIPSSNHEIGDKIELFNEDHNLIVEINQIDHQADLSISAVQQNFTYDTTDYSIELGTMLKCITLDKNDHDTAYATIAFISESTAHIMLPSSFADGALILQDSIIVGFAKQKNEGIYAIHILPNYIGNTLNNTTEKTRLYNIR